MADPIMKNKIILAVNNANRQEAYMKALCGVAECTVVEKLAEIPDLLRANSFNGILIDIQVRVRTDYMETVRILDPITMPVAILNINETDSLIKLFMINDKNGGAKSLEEFLARCSDHKTKILYPCNQAGLNLNATISTSDVVNRYTENTFAIGLSSSGCFLFTSNSEKFSINDRVWIDFVGLTNRRPVLGKIRWKCNWGETHSIPGIYVDFESMHESQHKELKALLATVSE